MWCSIGRSQRIFPLCGAPLAAHREYSPRVAFHWPLTENIPPRVAFHWSLTENIPPCVAFHWPLTENIPPVWRSIGRSYRKFPSCGVPSVAHRGYPPSVLRHQTFKLLAMQTLYKIQSKSDWMKGARLIITSGKINKYSVDVVDVTVSIDDVSVKLPKSGSAFLIHVIVAESMWLVL